MSGQGQGLAAGEWAVSRFRVGCQCLSSGNAINIRQPPHHLSPAENKASQAPLAPPTHMANPRQEGPRRSPRHDIQLLHLLGAQATPAFVEPNSEQTTDEPAQQRVSEKLFNLRKRKMLKAQDSKVGTSNKRANNASGMNVDVGEMRSAVDLINFQLILIESKIYKDIEPVPPLSIDEFSDAVRHLDYIKTKTLPFAIGEIVNDCK
ncbi:hypothetical protein AWZ03_000822 [Drosophila navojoa]|uniref:Uncharacterized protein n=1 Tax=Drosophila navojoa TaxID=7232 RepID=A0A484BUV1_DRONA|nr:hypothetical protein AWZ03_000822 [Drosophila navojoa]